MSTFNRVDILERALEIASAAIAAGMPSRSAAEWEHVLLDQARAELKQEYE